MGGYSCQQGGDIHLARGWSGLVVRSVCYLMHSFQLLYHGSPLTRYPHTTLSGYCICVEHQQFFGKQTHEPIDDHRRRKPQASIHHCTFHHDIQEPCSISLCCRNDNLHCRYKYLRLKKGGRGGRGITVVPAKTVLFRSDVLFIPEI